MKTTLFAPLALLIGVGLLTTACEQKPESLPTANAASQDLTDEAGAVITWSDATAWTATYQANHPNGLRSAFFSRNVFEALYNQPAATGIRIYPATDSGGEDCFVLVGATATSDLTDGQYTVYDKGNKCPDACVPSILNHGSSSPSTITGSSGQLITWAEAKAWTKTYQQNHPNSLKAAFFSTGIFKTLTDQHNAIGIRIYNATNVNGNCLVLVAASATADLTGEQYIVFDKGYPCPSYCHDSPLLN